jgi:eukaryotic-like serine/threonine-protein kinase
MQHILYEFTLFLPVQLSKLNMNRTSRIILLQIIIAAGILFLLIFLTLKGLEIYTRHGQSNPVPDFRGMSQAEAGKVARHHQMRIEVTDSVFIETAPAGAIVDQIPVPGHGVKENRTIFVSINSAQPEMVILPQLTDISYRQAQVLIENSGLEVGNISFRPSEYHNLVLEVQKDSVRVRSGQKIPKGSRLDIVLGRSQGNASTILPDLTGLTAEEAEQLLMNMMLNSGVIIYDNNIQSSADSLNARVWRQRPSPRTNSTINMGASVDMWVTTDSLKLNESGGLNF